MFVQIIRGQTDDRTHVERQLERWDEELRPGASGFLGDTTGISSDGTLFLMVRFESEAAARQNSDRPEQGQWWTETAKAIDDARFVDSSDVLTFLGGGSDDAGFVQVIDARVRDRARFEEVMRSMESELQSQRPDLLGGVVVWHGDDSMTQVVYFTSEADARENESREPGGDAAERLAEWDELLADVRYTDLPGPRLTS